MPGATILDLSQSEQDAMLAALRRARYGYLLAVHVLLLCAAGKSPTEIADFLFCSRREPLPHDRRLACWHPRL